MPPETYLTAFTPTFTVQSSPMDISSTTSSGPSNTKSQAKGPPRHRLNADGRLILEAYWENNPKVVPSLDVRKSLLAQIKKCGNEFYEMANINGWFKARVRTVPEPVYNSQYPTLTKPVLDHLEVLIKSTQNPSSEVIDTWVALLRTTGARREDVLNWVYSRTRTNRLPTPANTATPDRSPSLPSSSLNDYANRCDDDGMDVDRKPPVPSLSISTTQGAQMGQHSASSAGTPISPVFSSVSPATKFHYYQQGSATYHVSPISPISPPFAGSTVSFGPNSNQDQYRYQQVPPEVTAVQKTLFEASNAPPHNETHAAKEMQQENPRHSLSSTASPVFRSSPEQSSPSPSPPISPIVPQQNPHRHKMSILQAIVQGVSDVATNPNSSPGVLPSTPAEYEAMFAPYAERMSHLMEALEKL